MRTLNAQEVLAVTGAHGCGAVKVHVAVSVCLPKFDLSACLAGLIAKFKACHPVTLPKPSCSAPTPEVEDEPTGSCGAPVTVPTPAIN